MGGVGNCTIRLREAIVINHEVKLGNISQQGGGGSRQNQKISKEISDRGKGGQGKKIINIPT